MDSLDKIVYISMYRRATQSGKEVSSPLPTNETLIGISIMTHPIHSKTTLKALTIAAIKVIARQLGAIPEADKRVKANWVSAVLDHQSKFAPARVEAMEAHIAEVMDCAQVPQDLAEDLTLTLLGLEIVDRQDYIDECVPHGDIRYWVQSGDVVIGAISTWGKRYVLTSGKTYPTLFDAVTAFSPRGEVALAYSDATSQLRERFATAIDYA